MANTRECVITAANRQGQWFEITDVKDIQAGAVVRNEADPDSDVPAGVVKRLQGIVEARNLQLTSAKPDKNEKPYRLIVPQHLGFDFGTVE